jgi:hypothetical protein
LVRHFYKGVYSLLRRPKPKIVHWWADAGLLVADVAGVPEAAESVMEFVKLRTRPLSPLERKLAESVFGEALWLSHVRVDERAKIGCRARNMAYVSFFTVNNWGKLKPFTFIHELVHVWQYQQMGSAYISRAIRSQHSEHGYNYGGIERLRKHRVSSGNLTDFNLEQQADIVADYYAVREGLPTAWGKATRADLAVYEHYVAQVRATA